MIKPNEGVFRRTEIDTETYNVTPVVIVNVKIRLHTGNKEILIEMRHLTDSYNACDATYHNVLLSDVYKS
ncbi:MAG: hypothetical protein D8M57_19335 [Candidatus Scalindua sp. AMX11]|nr:MAG: hypothetical protein DWQ00_02495 [Candidatus Scalindua sp.]TDE63239.1 MAG: hypothetical protein D8M57_19335 [Candidatus Scalindua sp. AMX11]GJQ58362.1 MAG: hypothetical protein SCALA701_11630 [Candidatus Scalindua sp.]